MNNNNGRGIFYGVIGVATLVVAIIGATFAYFTASASNENVITGNAATITLSLAVNKVTHDDETLGGMIPMSNSMVENAINTSLDTRPSGAKPCVDDNGNAVCQIYEITISNQATAGVFVDGYVALINGSGTPSDYKPTQNNSTTMRWAQVFRSGSEGSYTYSTAGSPSLGAQTEPTFTALTEASGGNGKNTTNILSNWSSITGPVTISGNSYDAITHNYIRVSDHDFATAGTLSADENYDRHADLTSALVFNQSIAGITGSATSVDKTYYIVVWLAETGFDQTIGSTGEGGAAGAATDAVGFFNGQVKFVSAQGSEVSATFAGTTRVASDKSSTAQNNG